MDDFLRWLGKSIAIGICWVFLLSITFSGRPAFYYLNQIVVKNDLVQLLDQELSSLWGKTLAAIQTEKDKDSL